MSLSTPSLGFHMVTSSTMVSRDLEPPSSLTLRVPCIERCTAVTPEMQVLSAFRSVKMHRDVSGLEEKMLWEEALFCSSGLL